jgi:uncharacterized protein YndB with AHSA1/START domain
MSLKVETTVQIARPPDDVFAFIAEPENLPRWDPAIREVRRKEPGPVAKGSGLVVSAEESGRRVTVDSHVTEFEPGRAFGVAATFSGVPLRLQWRLDPSGSGTKLTTTAEAQLSGFLSFAGGMIRPIVTERLEKSHANLKRILEERQAA